jgi:hypothetical protein
MSIAAILPLKKEGSMNHELLDSNCTLHNFR